MSTASDFLDCFNCEQLIFPGEEIKELRNGVVLCEVCSESSKPDLASVSL